MFETDFDRSQPPVLPPRDVWLARYTQKLAEEEAAVTDQRSAVGAHAGEVIMIDSADYEEIVNG